MLSLNSKFQCDVCQIIIIISIIIIITIIIIIIFTFFLINTVLLFKDSKVKTENTDQRLWRKKHTTKRH